PSSAPRHCGPGSPTIVGSGFAGGRETVPAEDSTPALGRGDGPHRHPSRTTPRSRMNRLATLSLNNRSFIALVCIAVSIIGVFIITTMRQELIPSVSLPQIQVMTTAPGSSSEQVKDRLTAPIEQSLSGLENVEGTSSTSEAGMSMVTVELTYGTDIARASNQVD